MAEIEVRVFFCTLPYFLLSTVDGYTKYVVKNKEIESLLSRNILSIFAVDKMLFLDYTI